MLPAAGLDASVRSVGPHHLKAPQLGGGTPLLAHRSEASFLSSTDRHNGEGTYEWLRVPADTPPAGAHIKSIT
jgi:hypothetical protein